MTMKGRSFLEAANLLYEAYKKNGYVEECLARSCISRAYYAAFLEARDKAGIINQSGSVHRETHDYFITKKGSIKSRLVQLKGKRMDSDYKLGIDITPRDIESSLKLAQKIIQDLDQLA